MRKERVPFLWRKVLQGQARPAIKEQKSGHKKWWVMCACVPRFFSPLCRERHFLSLGRARKRERKKEITNEVLFFGCKNICSSFFFLAGHGPEWKFMNYSGRMPENLLLLLLFPKSSFLFLGGKKEKKRKLFGTSTNTSDGKKEKSLSTLILRNHLKFFLLSFLLLAQISSLPFIVACFVQNMPLWN